MVASLTTGIVSDWKEFGNMVASLTTGILSDWTEFGKEVPGMSVGVYCTTASHKKRQGFLKGAWFDLLEWKFLFK